ncbi:DUF5131 family protein [Streptomyces microflavus]
MSDRSAIEWTEATWNPTTGCDRVSFGCDNCYALALAKRLKAMGAAKYQNDGGPRTSGPGFDVTLHPDSLDVPYGWKAPRVVFVNSMSDLFHARVPLDFVRQVFKVMADTPQHTYQVLTKRARRQIAPKLDWPSNLWMGVSVESEAELPRIDDLRSWSSPSPSPPAPTICPFSSRRTWTLRFHEGGVRGEHDHGPGSGPQGELDRVGGGAYAEGAQDGVVVQ